ncbi:unnamed protein product [Strongylus vulgaris]|uniref:Uncharacterized protein n=1 Tax=Strongylus vulgaris TaxID=40348 RepID=A0A3P7JGN4_STRVU|nr:unnamed protein product [Strongylus vulgaris]
MMVTPDGQASKERRLDRGEYPVTAQLIWSRMPGGEQTVSNYRFVFRHKGARTGSSCTRFGSAEAASTIDSFLARFLQQPHDREYADLCMLPELTEQTLLDNLKDRFNSGHIYTYIGPILVAIISVSSPYTTQSMPGCTPKAESLGVCRRIFLRSQMSPTISKQTSLHSFLV